MACAVRSVHHAVPSVHDADPYGLDANGGTPTRSVDDGAGADDSLSFTRTASGTAAYRLDLEVCSGSGTATCTCTVTKS